MQNVGRVSRMVRLLTILQSEQQYEVYDLIKMLGVSRRTVFRDLEGLRKAGVPCYFDSKNRRYTIDTEFFLPAPDLSIQEAMSLLLLVHKARYYLPLPFRDSALRAILKIENNLSSKVKRYCNFVLQNISIKAGRQIQFDLLDKIFAQLQNAILRKRIVKINYYLPCEKKAIMFDLSPCHLICNDHTWYVLGKSSLHKGIHCFKLNQIKELSILNKYFIEDKRFNVSEYLGRAWSIAPEGILYNVKLRVAPEVAQSITEVQWHSTQSVALEDDGSAIVEFRVDGLNEIIRWILNYGNYVKVLSPRILQRMLIEVAQKIVETHQ